MIQHIHELILYGKKHGLLEEADEVYTINRLLELFGLQADEEVQLPTEERPLQQILDEMTDYALEKGMLSDDTVTQRDLFDTKIMGLLTPPPSQVRREFAQRMEKSAKSATDYFYHFSRNTNYIRTDRIARDEKWTTDTEFGTIDITINLSKPEKDPRDIAKAGKAAKCGYPSCLLCRENEGYAGNLNHPARQNHRIIPLTLEDEPYYLQYSPYVYYTEHCIVFHEKHIPMKIDKRTFCKLLAFVEQFPHYTIGSNADLPIVGGSILSHDHFQGGNYEFAMARADYETEFEMKAFPDVRAGIVQWPMSVIRLQSEDRTRLADAADAILKKWRSYTDEEAFIYAETDGTPHNTITPIARMRDGKFELDLVLRNNITTEECPLGLYHPHAQYHHIKKENIGLIEVMGLAVLPARLKKEMARLEDAILKGEDIRAVDEIAKHADWVDEWKDKYDLTAENIHQAVQKEIGIVFSKVLECAGVFKRTEDGRKYFERFIDTCKGEM